MGIHSRFSASSSSRWLKCPGSIELEHEAVASGQGDSDSVYAQEGTKAHEIADMLIRKGNKTAADYIGRQAGPLTIDRENAAAIDLYVNFVRSLIATAPRYQTEQRIVSDRFENLGGTVDFVAYYPDHVHIVDLKFGKGVAVDVEYTDEDAEFAYNTQTSIYGYLAQERSILKHGTYLPVKATIVQPRGSHPDGPIRSVEIPAKKLEGFVAALQIFFETYPQKTNELSPSDEACRFCKAKTICPALGGEVLDLLPVIDNNTANKLSSERLAELLDLKDRISKYFTAIEQEALARVEQGDNIPGYKPVERKGHRAWLYDDEEMVKRFRRRKLRKGDVTETKVKSPAKLERLGVSKEFINSLCTRPVLGIRLAKESHHMPEVDVKPVHDLFVDYSDDILT